MSNNAAPTKNGFNFQDTVALGYLIKDIKGITKINDEGKSDVDLFFSDKKGHNYIVFLQAKGSEPENIDKPNKMGMLQSGLRELIYKFRRNKKPREVIYVTNFHYPFGLYTPNFDFRRPEFFEYSYNEIEKYNHKVDDKYKSVKQRILDQIEKLADKTVKKGNNVVHKYSYINQLYNDPKKLNKILHKFYFVKFKYDGHGDPSNMFLVKKWLKKFQKEAHISGYPTESLLDHLYTLISLSSGNNNKYITKEQFIAEVFILVAINNNMDNKFFSYCYPDKRKDYFDSNDDFDKARRTFLSQCDYLAVEPINQLFNIYSKRHNIDNFYILLRNFVRDCLPKLSNILNEDVYSKTDIKNISDGNAQKFNELNYNNDKLIEFVEYISWMAILQRRKLKFINGASRYED